MHQLFCFVPFAEVCVWNTDITFKLMLKLVVENHAVVTHTHKHTAKERVEKSTKKRAPSRAKSKWK